MTPFRRRLGLQQSSQTTPFGKESILPLLRFYRTLHKQSFQWTIPAESPQYPSFVSYVRSPSAGNLPQPDPPVPTGGCYPRQSIPPSFHVSNCHVTHPSIVRVPYLIQNRPRARVNEMQRGTACGDNRGTCAVSQVRVRNFGGHLLLGKGFDGLLQLIAHVDIPQSESTVLGRSDGAERVGRDGDGLERLRKRRDGLRYSLTCGCCAVQCMYSKMPAMYSTLQVEYRSA